VQNSLLFYQAVNCEQFITASLAECQMTGPLQMWPCNILLVRNDENHNKSQSGQLPCNPGRLKYIKGIPTLYCNKQQHTYLGAIDNVQIVGDRFASPGNRPPQWRHLRDMHDGANVCKQEQVIQRGQWSPSSFWAMP